MEDYVERQGEIGQLNPLQVALSFLKQYVIVIFEYYWDSSGITLCSGMNYRKLIH